MSGVSDLDKAPVPLERLAAGLRQLRPRLAEAHVAPVYDRLLLEAAAMLEVPRPAAPAPDLEAAQRAALEEALAGAGLEVRS